MILFPRFAEMTLITVEVTKALQKFCNKDILTGSNWYTVEGHIDLRSAVSLSVKFGILSQIFLKPCCSYSKIQQIL